MTEEEYLLVTDRTKIRFAETLIRDCMPTSFPDDMKKKLVILLECVQAHIGQELTEAERKEV